MSIIWIIKGHPKSQSSKVTYPIHNIFAIKILDDIDHENDFESHLHDSGYFWHLPLNLNRFFSQLHLFNLLNYLGICTFFNNSLKIKRSRGRLKYKCKSRSYITAVKFLLKLARQQEKLKFARFPLRSYIFNFYSIRVAWNLLPSNSNKVRFYLII